MRPRRLRPTGRELLRAAVREGSWSQLDQDCAEYGILKDWLADEGLEQALEALRWAEAHPLGISRGPYRDPYPAYRWLAVALKERNDESSLYSLLPREAYVLVRSERYQILEFDQAVDAWEWLLVQWGVWDSLSLEADGAGPGHGLGVAAGLGLGQGCVEACPGPGS
jgi:hypothetical protein